MLSAPVYRVEIHGPNGSGKSLALVTLYDHLLNLPGLSGLKASPLLGEQLDKLHANKNLDKTDPATPEELEFTFNEERFVIASYPGEHLNRRGTDDFINEFGKRDAVLLIGVVNPFLYSQSVAENGFLNLVATLQHATLGYTLEAAVSLAGELLFHKSSAELFGVNSDLKLAIEQATKGNPAARVTYDSGQVIETKRFAVEPSQLGNNLLEQIGKTARQIVSNESNRLAYGQLKIIINRTPPEKAIESILVFSHMDLLSFTPAVRTENLMALYAEFFHSSERDFRISQLVFGKNRTTTLRPSETPPSVEYQREPSAAKQMWQSILTEKKLTRQYKRDRLHDGVAEGDKLTWFALFAEGVMIILRWFPWVALSVLTAVLIWSSIALQFGQFLRHVFVSLGYSTLMLALVTGFWVWFRAQFLPSRWIVKPGPTGPVIRLCTLFSSVDKLGFQQVCLHASLIGSLLRQGWATVGDNKVRRYAVPQLDRFKECAGTADPKLHSLSDILMVVTLALIILGAILWIV
jgi:hypothetical protein